MDSNVFDVVSLTSTCSHCPRSLVPGPLSPLKKLILKVCVQWIPMCSMSYLLPLLVPTVPGSLVPCPRSPIPPKKINPKGVCPMDSNVFDVVSLTSTCSHCPRSLVPCPRSPIPPKKIDPKGVCPMDSNVFDVVSLTSTCSHCPWSLVPCSLSPLKKSTPKVCVPWSPMCSMSCLVPLLVPTVPGPLSLSPIAPKKIKRCVSNGFQCVRCRVSYLYLFPLSLVPCPLSPVPPSKISPKGLYHPEGWSPHLKMSS